jgi:probable HAF family extracellular repeat protein
MTNLGTVDGDPCSQANMTNSKSQIVGISGTCDFVTVQHAFIWEKGQMTDLNSVVREGSDLQLLDALEINDRGEIIGQGALASGGQHVFLLIPCDHDHSNDTECENEVAQQLPIDDNLRASISEHEEVSGAPALSSREIATRIRGRVDRNHSLRAWFRK